MVSRRQSLQFAGTAVLAALAGCSSSLVGTEASPEHELHVDRITQDPVTFTLYDPPDGDLFGEPARAALDAILPDGQYTTHGYEALQDGNYVEHDGRYYRTVTFVTGRAELSRPVVRVSEVDREGVPDDAVLIDSLDQPSARPLKILHSHAITGGDSAASDLLRGDAYVMARPAERDSRLATELDGEVVTMTDDGAFAQRVEVRREQLTLTEHTVQAVEVADSREVFRDVVLASVVDADLATVSLSTDARDLLDEAISRGTYTETGELSSAFEALLAGLGFDPDESATGRIVWYGGSLFRASFYAPAAN
jgi:hypothetical protein